jgi:hypothetical protein
VQMMLARSAAVCGGVDVRACKVREPSSVALLRLVSEYYFLEGHEKLALLRYVDVIMTMVLEMIPTPANLWHGALTFATARTIGLALIP